MNSIVESVIILLKDALTYLPAGCTWAAGIILIVLTINIIYKFCTHRNVTFLFLWRLFLLFLFIAYTYCILRLTLLSRPTANYGGIDWRFLAKWNENTAQKAFLIANIIMFIPFGVLLPMMSKWTKHILIALPTAIVCSIAIEAMQLKYQLGYCQLDDVIANSVGFLVGFLIYLVIADIYYFLNFITKRLLCYVKKHFKPQAS
ncbi:MAG: VanZ family protein [Lachnospiraceae bacterium]|nr:VanZ family protein [Lachnospiraceae bacterium]